MKTAILNMKCKDKKGIIATVTNFIFKNSGNIIALDEFVDSKQKLFFMRLKWDLSKFKISKKNFKSELRKVLQTKGINEDIDVYYSDTLPRMAIFVSQYDHCLYDLLIRHKSGELNCKIPIIISNHNNIRKIAESFNIPFFYFNINKQNKKKIELKQLEILQKYNVDFIVLARYMQILSKNFVNEYKNKIINIHHSFLPAFVGSKPYHQAYERGVKIIGATAHFVTKDLDKGPIIQQDVVNVNHWDTVSDLVIKGRDIERRVLAEAVKLFISHRLFVSKNRTIIL